MCLSNEACQYEDGPEWQYTISMSTNDVKRVAHPKIKILPFIH